MLKILLFTIFIVSMCVIFRKKWLVVICSFTLLVVEVAFIILEPGVLARRVMKDISLSNVDVSGMEGVQLYVSEVNNIVLPHLILSVGMFLLVILGLFYQNSNTHNQAVHRNS